ADGIEKSVWMDGRDLQATAYTIDVAGLGQKPVGGNDADPVVILRMTTNKLNRDQLLDELKSLVSIWNAKAALEEPDQADTRILRGEPGLRPCGRFTAARPDPYGRFGALPPGRVAALIFGVQDGEGASLSAAHIATVETFRLFAQHAKRRFPKEWPDEANPA